MTEPAALGNGRCFALLERIATLAADAVDVEAALSEALTEICVYAGCPIGHASVASGDGLVDAELWHGTGAAELEPLRAASAALSRRRDCIVGNVLATREPTWVPNVLGEPTFLRRAEAAKAGITSVFAFPLLAAESAVGVVELFGIDDAEPTVELQRAAHVIGIELGRMLDRARLRTQLRKGEERYRLLFESATDAIFLEDTDSRIVAANPAAERLTGYAVGELVGRPVEELLASEWRDRSRYQHELKLEGKALQTQHESVIVNRTGQRVPVEVTSALVYLNGAVVGVQAVARDLSARRRAELALCESEERFRVAFDAAAIGMALTSIDGRWLKVNNALCEIVGYSAAELLTMGYQDITHPDDLADDFALGQRMLAGEFSSFQLDKRYIHRRGHAVWVHLNVALVRAADGSPAYSVAQILDLSGRRRAHDSRPSAGRPASPHTTLTAREREVLSLLAGGGTSAEVAAALGIGEETVQTHVRRARVKLEARTRTEAVATALTLGLLDPPAKASARAA